VQEGGDLEIFLLVLDQSVQEELWWQDILWGLWNGATAWALVIARAFDGWKEFTLYDSTRSGWYDLSFLIGANLPIALLYWWRFKK
jgi:hypothetical protein